MGKPSSISGKTRLESIRNWNSLSGKPYSRSNQVLPRQGAQFLVRLIEARDSSGYSDGQWPEVIGIINNVAVQSQIHPFGSGKRSLLPEIEGRGMAIFTVVNQEPSSTNIAGPRQDNSQSKSCCYCRIHRIAALFESFHPNFRCQTCGTRYYPIFYP